MRVCVRISCLLNIFIVFADYEAKLMESADDALAEQLWNVK